MLRPFRKVTHGLFGGYTASTGCQASFFSLFGTLTTIRKSCRRHMAGCSLRMVSRMARVPPRERSAAVQGILQRG